MIRREEADLQERPGMVQHNVLSLQADAVRAEVKV